MNVYVIYIYIYICVWGFQKTWGLNIRPQVIGISFYKGTYKKNHQFVNKQPCTHICIHVYVCMPRHNSTPLTCSRRAKLVPCPTCRARAVAKTPAVFRRRTSSEFPSVVGRQLTVDSKTVGYGFRVIYGGVPSFFCFGILSNRYRTCRLIP